jgi:hypothetical protein
MSVKTLSVVLALVAVVGAGWYFRDSPEMIGMLSGIRKNLDALQVDNGVRAGKDGKALSADKKDAASKAAGGLRKCVSGTQTTYTDEVCPPGSRELPISGGNVTVVPATRGAPASEADKSVKPSLREAARTNEDMNLRDKRVEQGGGR